MYMYGKVSEGARVRVTAEAPRGTARVPQDASFRRLHDWLALAMYEVQT